MNQTQKFSMNPQTLQSLVMMELPIVDLREKIGEELEKNPALEVLEDHSAVSLDPGNKLYKENLLRRDSDLRPAKKSSSGATADEHQRFIEGVLSHPETLQDHLLWQLRLEPLPVNIRRIGELLIQNLNEDGFHKEAPEVLLENENPELIKKAMKLVRTFNPVGTCTADYRESLTVQAELLPNAPRGLKEALSYLDLLEKGKTALAAKKLGCTKQEINYIFERIKELSPFPGRRFFSGKTRFVIPDIQVIKKEGEFVIILNEEEIPVLGINPFFMKIAAPGLTKAAKQATKPARDFARENIKEARWFINAINQRNHTLLRVSRAIVEFQRPFFTKGPKHLAPLTLRDIAEELALHETTVSRTAHGKYMQTEWGFFEIRHFFSNSITGTGSSGSEYSKEGVKEIIKEILELEAKNKHLSDHDVAELLAKRGIPLARRTVTKYRNELNVGPSFNR